MENKKLAVNKYLEQVKILTALSTALLISPSIIQKISIHKESYLENIKSIKILMFISNISFLLAIIMTYFIYSSIVGYIDKNRYDINRPATSLNNS